MGVLVKPTKDQIKIFYSQALDRCVEAFSRLDEKDLGKKASDEWTAKQHLAHLASTCEDEELPLTRQALAGEAPNVPGFERRDQQMTFREAGVRKLGDISTPELLQRFRSAFGEHLAMLESLSESDLDKPARSPAWDRSGTVRDFFFGAYLFLAGQYQEIRRVNKKKLPHWIEASSPDMKHYHMDRIFHYMPLIFRSDKAEDMKATYQFTMEGEGGGQWHIRIADGKAEADDGPAEPHDSEIKTKPELWVDLSSGDLNPPMAIMTRKVKLGGNPALAMKLSHLFGSQE
ncbi:MAG: hypothetical protein E6J42_02110 [Chloroflexi bacterium]|nr:MAG: hypothetical protein E6J42_02110 [Chloroflexota bacterium]